MNAEMMEKELEDMEKLYILELPKYTAERIKFEQMKKEMELLENSILSHLHMLEDYYFEEGLDGLQRELVGNRLLGFTGRCVEASRGTPVLQCYRPLGKNEQAKSD